MTFAATANANRKKVRWIMLLQILGSAAILALVPGNILKSISFLAWWLLTFGKVTRAELVTFLSASAFFTYMDYQTLLQGIFRFSSPDFLLMPCYEPLLWGYLLLHTQRMLQGGSPRTSWCAGFVLLIVLCVPYLFITDQLGLFVATTSVVVAGLAFFRERDDFVYAGYMVLLGILWEYTGVWSGQWSYPNPPAGGVPPWFIPTFGGVGLIFRRMVLPLWDSSSSRN